jgi:hypothetical protein
MALALALAGALPPAMRAQQQEPVDEVHMAAGAPCQAGLGRC